MTHTRISQVLLLVACLTLSTGAVHGAIVLPPSGGGLSQTNGNFEVYSLPFLDNLFGGFSVPSSPGQIQDGIVAITGSSGNPVTTNPTGIENAYETPSGGGSPDFFTTGTSPDPGGTNSVETLGLWDADVAAIRTFLSTMGGELVFFFNLNEQNASDGQGLLFAQDELGWARLDLIDDQDPTRNLTFFLSAHDDPTTPADELALGLAASAISAPDPNGAGASLPGPLDPQWSYIHGIITVAADGSFLHYGPPVPGDPAGASAINQNLGADEAAFAIYNKQLSDLVLDPLSGYDRITIDIRLARINNGYEQAFILPMVTVSNEIPPVIPEAGTLVMWSVLSFSGVAGVYFRRRSLR